MPDDVAAPVAAAEAPAAETPQATPAAGDKPKAGSPELARWHARRAQAVLAKEQDGTAEPPAGAPPKDPKTGRFQKRAKTTAGEPGSAGAHNPGVSGATPEPATKPKPAERDEGAIPDSLAAVRRLASEGKLEEAFKRAFGRTPDELLNSKSWAAFRAESKKVRTEAETKLRESQTKEQQLRQLQQELSAEFKPLHDARKALQAGDLDEAFKLFAGTDFNTFSRNYLRQSTGPNVGKDPAFLELQKEIRAMREENQQLRQREQEQQKQQTQEQARKQYMDNMVATLEASDDPRISRAAKRHAFQQKVLQIQREHYDAASDWTIPHIEAAQLAIEALENEYGEWGEVFGGSSSRPEPRGETRTPPARAATPARQTPSRVTTLSQKEAAEAATQPKLKGQALIDKYARIARANLVNGAG